MQKKRYRLHRGNMIPRQKKTAATTAIRASFEHANEICGIPFFESFISEIANISPIRKARRDRFFEDDKKEERKKLLRKIDNWIELLEGKLFYGQHDRQMQP